MFKNSEFTTSTYSATDQMRFNAKDNADYWVETLGHMKGDTIVVCAYCKSEWGDHGTCDRCGGNVRQKVKIQFEEGK